MATVRLSDILELPIDERIRLVEEIWESIARDAESFPLSPELIALLDERLAEFKVNPDEGEPWEVVRERILKRICRSD